MKIVWLFLLSLTLGCQMSPEVYVWHTETYFDDFENEIDSLARKYIVLVDDGAEILVYGDDLREVPAGHNFIMACNFNRRSSVFRAKWGYGRELGVNEVVCVMVQDENGGWSGNGYSAGHHPVKFEIAPDYQKVRMLWGPQIEGKGTRINRVEWTARKPHTTPVAENQETMVLDPSVGLIGWWRFNGDCLDSSGNGNDGENNNVAFTDDRFGNHGCAGFFDWKGYVRVKANSQLNGISKAVSMMAWLKLNLDTYEWIPIMCKMDGGIGPRQFGFQMTNEPRGIMQINDENSGVDMKKQVLSHNVFFDKEWHHYALTFDGEILVAYVDGVERGRVPCPGKLPRNDDDLLIGTDPPGHQEYLRGCLDGVRLYNRALSAEEIAIVYKLVD